MVSNSFRTTSPALRSVSSLQTAILRAFSRSETVDLATPRRAAISVQVRPCLSSCFNYKSVNFLFVIVEQTPNYKGG